jgi:hypothetical protein
MVMPYISPAQMEAYRHSLKLFAKGAATLECIRSHFYSDKTGTCDLTEAKEQEEIFVLANRLGHTLKVSRNGMQIVANVLDIEGADQWYEHLKEQRKAEKERLAQDAARREEQKTASKVVLFKKKPTDLLEKNRNS